jgi:hypothetical protein
MFIQTRNSFEKVLSKSDNCSRGDKEYSEFPVNGQKVAIIKKDRKISCRLLCCDAMDTMKVQVTNIYKLNHQI